MPIVLLRIRALPRKRLGLSPFEVMYGRPMLPPGLPPEPPPIPSFLHSPLLAELRNALWKYINHNLLAPDPQASMPPLQTGDMVYLSDNPQGDVNPKWQGPFKITLLTPTAAKLEKVTSWVHLSCLKQVIESVMPSNHLILCRPLLLLPSIFPSFRVFSNESPLHITWPEYWSFSFSISPFKEHSGLISWLDLLAVQGTPLSLLQHHI